MKRVIQNVFIRLPWLKRALIRFRNWIFPNTSISSHYVTLAEEQANSEAHRLRNSWQNEGLPGRQRELVDQQLQLYKRGKSIDVFDTFVTALRALPNRRPRMTLLEIGCSSGYYSEVISIAELPFLYTGCDYSAHFIKLASARYPATQFHVADATELPYPDNGFDVVVSGCCLLHIPEYEKAIRETARVCRDYAMFHRTPVVRTLPNQWFLKKAYGIETVEIHFNEGEFLTLLQTHGLALIATYTLSEEQGADDATPEWAVRSYLCRKVTQ